MKIFCDTSVLIAACESETGASRLIFKLAQRNQWDLITVPYARNEIEDNLPDLSLAARHSWPQLLAQLIIKPTALTLDRPAVFPVMKDRPILFSALAWADVLVTLDQNDFGGVMNKPFYSLSIMKPGTFIETERAAGRLVV